MKKNTEEKKEIIFPTGGEVTVVSAVKPGYTANTLNIEKITLVFDTEGKFNGTRWALGETINS